MSTQGTDQLNIEGIPSVKKLWNGRYRLEFFCTMKDKNEGWYGDNISGWLPEFGILQQTGFESDPSWELTDEEDWIYDDMRLVDCEVEFIPALKDNAVRLVYETLTASYVEEKGEDIDHELNGLKRVVRTFVALPEASYSKVVGTDTIEVDGTTLFLGSANIKKTDAKWELAEQWLEAGELSRSDNFEDAKGPITITNIGACPATPVGFTPVDKKEDNTQGFPTCTITFYEDDAVLSRSNDYVGSQLAESIEVFNPSVEPTPTNGGVLGNQSVSNVDGIPTTRYTFLVPSILSQSEDKIGSQLAIVIEAFNETPSTPAGYVLAKTDVSDVEGIPTRRYTFLNPSVLSQSTDNVGSQLAITIEAFSETPSTPVGYELAREDVSDFEGIPTRRFTFLNPSVLSRSEDKVGSQLAIVIEAFSETPSTPSGYVLASSNESNVEGIPTKRYTFLKSDVELSRSDDLVGSQLAITIEQFDGTPSTPAGYSIARTQDSDVGGIPTKRYTFLKPSVLSRSEDLVGSQLAIVIEAFNETPATPSGYSLAKTNVSDVEGIVTNRYTFLKPSILSKSEDLIGSQLAIVIEAFDEVPSTPSGYAIAKKDTSDFEGITTQRYTFLNPSILSVSQSFTDASTSITVNAFNRTSAQVDTALSEVTTNHKLISTREDDFEGIETTTFTYELESYDVIDNEQNGLRRVLRTRLLLAAQFYASEVGVTTIAHEINAGTPTTLYLAAFKIDDTASFRKVTETWMEAGQLSENDPITGSDRIRVRTIVWQMVQGSDPSGYVASSIKTDNIEGFKTISVSYYLSADLSVDYVYETTVPFTIPGTVDVQENDFGLASTLNLMLDVSPPVPTLCEAIITEKYTDEVVIDSDVIYQPNKWTGVLIEGIAPSQTPFASTSTYRNHIALSTGGELEGAFRYVQGNQLFAGTTGYIRIDGPIDGVDGYVDPAGTDITANITLTPAFRLEDGTQYYKKVVTQIKVPARG